MNNGIQLDYVNSEGMSSGTVADALIQSGFNVNSLRTNGVLRKDEWKQYDQTVVEIARQNLVGVGDLLSKGLRHNVDNPLGITRVEWEKISDMEAAEINMSGVTEGAKDRVTFELEGVPLPIIHKDFSINIRALEASRNSGQSVDTLQAQIAAKLVAEATETMLFDGVAGIKMGGSTILGYKTATNRNVGSITNWAAAGTTGSTILSETLAMILALQSDNYNGPYGLYIPLDYHNKLQDDFKTNSDKSIMERLLEIDGLDFIKVSRNLPAGGAGQVIMVQLTSNVVDMVDGMQPTVLQWDSKGGMMVNFKVMSIMVPRFKSDANDQSGIAHFSV